LRDAGFGFETITLDRLARGAFLPGTEFWVDSLYIPELDEASPFGPDDRIFYIIHSLPSEDPGAPPGPAARLRQAEDRLFSRASGFLVPSPLAGERLEARGCSDRAILLVPPAPCVLPTGPHRQRTAFAGLIVSSLIRGKGVPDFLEALGREVTAGDNFEIRIAGRTDIEPETAASCLERVNAHPLLRTRIVHMGFIPCEELGREYEECSVLISPSPNETFGMAFHEALVFGLPILARRAPYSEPYISPGRTGLLFGSTTELARGTLELVRRPGRLRAIAASSEANRPAAAATWAGAARSFLSQRKSCAIFRKSP